jgi:hypothetical protein
MSEVQEAVTPAAVSVAPSKVRSICIDTLTAIQNEEYMRDKKKAGHDKWKDYGQDIYSFNADLQALGFELILVLGEPGTGKSSGMRTLHHNSNIWYNTDNKNPTWQGGREEYGRKVAPRAPFHIIPSTYSEIIQHIQMGLERGMFEQDRFAFISGHTETYKVGNDTKERLKILGTMGTKMQLEGKMESVFYSRVEKVGSDVSFFLETQNSGFNTARSPQGLFEGKIENDYQMILDKLLTY